jgi:hypothetical protein
MTRPSDRQVHLILLAFWVVLVIPTIIWWSDSILWVAFMSLYAIITSHWGAYQAAKVEDLAQQTEIKAEEASHEASRAEEHAQEAKDEAAG